MQDKTPIDELVLKITKKEEPRAVRGGTLHVCNLTGVDEDGDSVTVTLWNDDIRKVKEGDSIKITNGWASSFQDKMQVSPGRRGQLEVLGGGEAKAPAEEPEADGGDVEEVGADEVPEDLMAGYKNPTDRLVEYANSFMMF